MSGKKKEGHTTPAKSPVSTPTTGGNSNNVAYEMGDLAYSKILLHAAKFHWASVCGLVLSSSSSPSSSSASGANSSATSTPSAKTSPETTSTTTIEVVDVVPLFHTAPTASSLEVACMMVEEHCAEKNLAIAGLYFADAFIPEGEEEDPSASIPPLARKIASQIAIKTKNNKAMLLVVDNKRLAKESEPLPFRLLRPSGAEWKVVDSVLRLTSEDSPKLFTARARNTALVQRLVDFDEALEDPEKDWRNSELLLSS